MPRLSGLSVFFPCHNEADNLQPLVEQALEVLPEVAERFEIIVVNDGSTDATGELAERLAAEHETVRVVHHEVNRGYGGALQSGFGAARHDWVFFTDGDGQFDLRELGPLVELRDRADLVIGYRLRRADPFYRTLNARMYRMLVRLVLGLRVRDIDCAFKLLPRRVLEAITLRSTGALVSAELLVKARRAGFSWVEAGVHHYPRRAGQQSGASPRVVLRMFRELWGLRQELAREARQEGRG